jgi:hypothetical protein
MLSGVQLLIFAVACAVWGPYDKNIMEFEKKGLGNSEKVMDLFAL